MFWPIIEWHRGGEIRGGHDFGFICCFPAAFASLWLIHSSRSDAKRLLRRFQRRYYDIPTVDLLFNFIIEWSLLSPRLKLPEQVDHGLDLASVLWVDLYEVPEDFQKALDHRCDEIDKQGL